jgi:hypothetical protein
MPLLEGEKYKAYAHAATRRAEKAQKRWKGFKGRDKVTLKRASKSSQCPKTFWREI